MTNERNCKTQKRARAQIPEEKVPKVGRQAFDNTKILALKNHMRTLKASAHTTSKIKCKHPKLRTMKQNQSYPQNALSRSFSVFQTCSVGHGYEYTLGRDPGGIRNES